MLAGWHPVAAEHDLATAPVAAQWLATPVVLWRDAAGVARAAFDRCPHRGTRLSLGAVRDVAGEKRLECPYHGWQFGADGRCLRIPAAPGFMPSAAQRLETFECREAHGIVWIRSSGGEGDGAFVIPALPALADLPPRLVVCGPYDVATAAPRIVENFLDVSHFAFVHEGSLGDRAFAEVPPYEVALDASGAPGAPACRAWQPRAGHGASVGAWVDYRYRVLTPFAAVLHKSARTPQGEPVVGVAIAMWACPLGDEATRVWFSMYTIDASSDDETLRRHQDAIFAQDRPILESQRPKRLPLESGEVHSAADRLCAAYRRYLRDSGVSVGVA